MSDTKAKLDEIRQMMNSPKTIEGFGLSNEENIHIYGYHPEDEQIVRHFVKKLQESKLYCNLKVFDLYEIFLSIGEKKKIMKVIPKLEEKKGSKGLFKEIQKFATVNAFISEMQYEPHGEKDVILITGIGSAFPFMRIHKLLNAIQPYFSNMPIFVLYPGEYDGHELRLFNCLKANPYYRAFNIK